MCSEYKEYDLSGQLRVHESRNSDGFRHGERRLWYPNGQLARRCRYVNGKLEGLSEEWYEDGRRRVREFFMNDQHHGKVIYFDRVMEIYFQYGNEIVGEFIVSRFDRYHEHIYCKDGNALFNLTFRLKMTLLHIKHRLRKKARNKNSDSFDGILIPDLARIVCF